MHYAKATILGRGEFPIDMLRYDGAFPYSERDATIIAESLSGNIRGSWEVTIAVYTYDIRQPFHLRRWHSFGCEVTLLET